MVVCLDLKDRKILSLLSDNSRVSNSFVAKKVGLSKPAIEYRLKRFSQNNMVFCFPTIVDFTKLGFFQYKIYFKFQNTSLIDEKKIIDYWIGNNNSIWVAQIRCRWDLTVSIISKNNFLFGKILSDFLNNFSKFILEKDVLLTEYSPVFPRQYLSDTVSVSWVYGKPTEIVELDDIDKTILKKISNNARKSLIDIVSETNLTKDIISYRLKKLLKKNIIFQFSCHLNLNKIGIKHYKIIFRTKNFDETAEKKIRQYAANHKRATQFLRLIGSWDLEIEFETENEDELYQILNEIRKKFHEIIRDFDIIRIVETNKFNLFPFK